MITGLIAGRLMEDAEQRKGRADSLFVVAKVRAQSSDGDSLIVNVIAFDETPRVALLALREGDSIAVSGSLAPKVWTDKQGNARPALDLIAHRVLSVDQPQSHD